MKTTLVVIDMQHDFLWAGVKEYHKAIRGTLEQIRLAKNRGDHILMVEFDAVARGKKINDSVGSSARKSHTSLTKALKNYPKVTYVFKNQMDGGAEVVKTLRDKKIPRSTIRVCGVYAGHCVENTVMTMSKKLTKSTIKIVKSGIAEHAGDKKGLDSSFARMTTRPNIRAM